MCACLCQYFFAKGESIDWVLFAEYRTVSLCAHSPSLIDECCSVSLLVSSCFAAAKLHHIAGRNLHRPPASTAGLVSQVRAFGTYPRFSFSFPEPAFRQTGTADDEQYAGGYLVEFTDDDLVE